MKGYKYITFDLLGTLIDTKTAVEKYFQSIIPEKENKKTSERLYHEWNKKNFENMILGKVPFKKSLLETVAPVLEKQNILSQKNIKEFYKQYAEAKPFPETKEVLKKLEKNYKLAIISNSDNELVKNTLLETEFHKIITAEDVGYYYKPNKHIFEHTLKELSANKNQVLHVASSIRADLRGVGPLGWDIVLVNRNNNPLGNEQYKPTFETKNLKGVLSFLRT